jgi:phosphotransferase system HPr (HPr) family protein
MIEFTRQVGNRIGLHLRAAGEFVKVAAQFTSEVRVYHGEKFANGKSILGLASLAAARGAQVRVEIEGPDEAAARKAIEALFDAKFYED